MTALKFYTYLYFTDRTLPTGVIPVVILYKTSPAAPQVYTSSSSRVSNHFNYIEDLLQTCIFVSDRVLDTSLNGNYFTLLI